MRWDNAKQIKNKINDMLMYIRKSAEKENATETLKAIDYKIQIIKLKLQPMELPDIQP